MSITPSIALCLSLFAADLEVGDKVVTLNGAPVMSGSEKLGDIRPSVELTVTDLKSPWVGVTATQDGKELRGWILDENLILNPVVAFLRLTVRTELQTRSAGQYFKWMDRDQNEVLTRGEFLFGTENQTLDSLNEQLQDLMTALRPNMEMDRRHGRDPNEHFQRWVWMVISIPDIGENQRRQKMPFVSWKKPPTEEDARQIAGDYLRTKDIRRSRLAQELLDREDPKVRAHRAEVLFHWADSNRNGSLSLKEFKQALPQLE